MKDTNVNFTATSCAANGYPGIVALWQDRIALRSVGGLACLDSEIADHSGAGGILTCQVSRRNKFRGLWLF